MTYGSGGGSGGGSSGGGAGTGAGGDERRRARDHCSDSVPAGPV